MWAFGFSSIHLQKIFAEVWSVKLGKEIADLLLQVADTEFIGQSHKLKEHDDGWNEYKKQLHFRGVFQDRKLCSACKN